MLVLTIALLGACGSDDDGGAVDTPLSTSTSEAAGGTAVEVKGFKFTPATVNVKVGDTVTWRFSDPTTHTVTADDKSFDSGGHSSGDTFDHTFGTAGSFTYHCTIHETMTGTVSVSG